MKLRRGFELDGASVGENGEMGNVGYSEVVLSAKIFPILGISCGGNEKRFLDLLTVLEEGQCQEVMVSISKQKGRRELINLECSINFDVRGDCLVGVKARGFFEETAGGFERGSRLLTG
jgi:hypothetical protein